MACTKQSSKCSIIKSCCQSHVQEILTYVVGIFNEIDIDYWIDFNLLLGILENKMYVEGNVLSILSKDFGKLLELNHRIYEDGFYLTSYIEGGCSKLKVHYSRKNFLNIEIIGWENERGILFKRANGIVDKNTMFSNKYILPLEKTEYNGKSYSCVNNINKFYTIRTGK